MQGNKVKGKNCKGYEKVERFKTWINNNNDVKVIKMVSDSKHDLSLYNIAEMHYKVENGKLVEGKAERF